MFTDHEPEKEFDGPPRESSWVRKNLRQLRARFSPLNSFVTTTSATKFQNEKRYLDYPTHIKKDLAINARKGNE